MTAYVTEAPIARAEGDVLWLDVPSGKEMVSFALTRNAAMHLWRALNLEGPLLFAAPEGEVVRFRKECAA